MPGLGDVLGPNSVASQFLIWQVLGQLVTPVLNPATQAMAARAWRADPNVPGSPPDLAQLVARGKANRADVLDDAASSGIGHTEFDRMVALVQHGPDLTIGLEGLRRGLITDTEFDAILTDAGIEAKHHQLVRALAVIPPSAAEALTAYLEGQVTRDVALKRYTEAGGDPTWFQSAVDTVGQAPTPDQALVLANRGIIPWDGEGPGVVSFRQAFLEGPWRNKWEPSFRELGKYLPPPRTVTAMLTEGSLTDAQALTLLEHQGLTPELAAAYVTSAHHTKTAADRELAKGDVLALYEAQLIDAAQATPMLEALNYSPEGAAFLLSLADVRRAAAAVNGAVSRVKALYVAHKISHQDAVGALNALQLPAAQVQDVVAAWDVEAAVNVKTLTEAQIVSAWRHTIIGTDEAMRELETSGYTPRDAWILLSIANTKPLPNEPPAGPSRPGPA